MTINYIWNDWVFDPHCNVTHFHSQSMLFCWSIFLDYQREHWFEFWWLHFLRLLDIFLTVANWMINLIWWYEWIFACGFILFASHFCFFIFRQTFFLFVFFIFSFVCVENCNKISKQFASQKKMNRREN